MLDFLHAKDDPGQHVGRGSTCRCRFGRVTRCRLRHRLRSSQLDAGQLQRQYQRGGEPRLSNSAMSVSARQHDALMFGAVPMEGRCEWRVHLPVRRCLARARCGLRHQGQTALSPCQSLPPKSNSRAPGLRRSSWCAATSGSDLGALLPTWQSFGVDSYAQYMAAVSTLQKTVMGDAANIQPELLATTVFSHQVAGPGRGGGLGLCAACDRRRSHACSCFGQAGC